MTGKLSVRTYGHPYGYSYSYNNDTIDLLGKAECLFSFDVNPRDIGVEDVTLKRQTLPRHDCNAFPHGKTRSLRPAEAVLHT